MKRHFKNILIACRIVGITGPGSLPFIGGFLGLLLLVGGAVVHSAQIPPPSEAELDAQLEKARTQEGGPYPYAFFTIANHFGNRGNAERKQEVMEEMFALLRSLPDGPKRAEQSVAIARNMIELNADPEQVEALLEDAFRIAKAIDFEKQSLEKSWAIWGILRARNKQNKPEEALRAIAEYPAGFSSDGKNLREEEKRTGVYAKDPPIQTAMICEVLLNRAENGDFEAIRKIVRENLCPQDGVYALFYTLDPKRSDLIIPTFHEAVETMRKIEDPRLATDLLQRIVRVMGYYEYFDEAIDAVEYCPLPEKRLDLIRTVAAKMEIKPDAHLERAPRKIRDELPPNSVFWWKARTFETVYQHKDDKPALIAALTRLLEEAMAADSEREAKAEKPLDNPENFMRWTCYAFAVVDAAAHSPFHAAPYLEHTLAAVAALPKTPETRLLRLFACENELSRFSHYEGFSRSVYDEVHPKVVAFVEQFHEELDFTDTREAVLSEAILPVLVIFDSGASKKWLLAMEKAVAGLAESESRDYIRSRIVLALARVGCVEEAVALAKRIDMPEIQGSTFVMLVNTAFFRTLPQSDWSPETWRQVVAAEEKMKRFQNKVAADESDILEGIDFTALRCKVEEKDIRQTIDDLLRHIAAMKDRQRQGILLVEIAETLALWNFSQFLPQTESCYPLYVEQLRACMLFDPRTKNACLKMLDAPASVLVETETRVRFKIEVLEGLLDEDP